VSTRSRLDDVAGPAVHLETIAAEISRRIHALQVQLTAISRLPGATLEIDVALVSIQGEVSDLYGILLDEKRLLARLVEANATAFKAALVTNKRMIAALRLERSRSAS
jgi:hypothetical protein